ncbi:MAG: hypothetical protein RBT60_10480 [Candidatus Krumholzibacteria bacterium]|jgi:hypothetical protein|nr:hypothetical protein [Candidatus Krumholzibacteria bacterium]
MRSQPANVRTQTSRGRFQQPWLLPALLVAVLVAALAVRVRLASLDPWPTVDGVHYLELARQLVTTGRLSFSCFPPGWPLLIGVPLLFLDKSDPLALLRAAQAANVACGVALPLLGFRMLRPDLGRWAAFAGAVVLAFLPLNIILSKVDYSEMSYTCGLVAAWLAYRSRRWLTTGLLFGFTYLIRPEALLAGVGLLLFEAVVERRWRWRAIAGLAAFVVPYLIYIRVAGGAWGISSKDVALTLSLEAHPGWSYAGLVAGNAGRLAPMLVGLLGAPLVALAVVGMVARRGRWLLMLAPFLPVPFIINPMDVRFWQPYVPFFLLAAGLGIGALAERAARAAPAGRQRAAVVLLAVAAIGGAGAAALDDIPWIAYNAEATYGLKDAGIWLRDRVDAETIIADYKPYTAFWAGCRFVKIPDEDNAAAIVSWARNRGAQYLIVNVHVVRTLAPGLDPLLQRPLPAHLAGRLTLVQLLEYDRVEHTTAIYRIERGL